MNSQNNRLGRLRRAETAEAGMRALAGTPGYYEMSPALAIYIQIEGKRARRISPPRKHPYFLRTTADE
jgi:hypothetical protein